MFPGPEARKGKLSHPNKVGAGADTETQRTRREGMVKNSARRLVR
jgi:hypothetical protein